MAQNDRIDFDPRIWGPKKWFVLETIVRSYPIELTIDQQKHIKDYVISTSEVLPCSICRSHMKDYMKDTDMINMDFSKRITIENWINDLHNLRRHGNEKSLKEVNKYYKDQYDKFNTNYTDLFYIFVVIAIVTLLIKCVMQ